MIRSPSIIFTALCAFVAGCSSLNNRDSEVRAGEHLAIARKLEAESRWHEAALEYAIVAEIYPETEHYESSVRRAAILFSHPDNASSNDSLALTWLSSYSGLSISDEERELVQSYMRLVEDRSRLRHLLELQVLATDSVSRVATERQLEFLESKKKIKDLEKRLEEEIAQRRKELDRLREIDMQVGRDKEKEPPK
jgi:hypothetical protein